MEFPKTMKEFIESFSFKDSEEVYTNGAELVPVFRVEQGLEHYEKQIRAKAIDEFAERLKEKYGCLGYIDEIKFEEVDKIAEQMKGGGKNG